jgi:hypothetical protein
MLHEPVHERAPIIDNLTLHEYLCMLNSCDERPARGHVDLELLEPDERDLAGDHNEGTK